MGGGNLQKSQMARERNQAKASKGEGGGGGSEGIAKRHADSATFEAAAAERDSHVVPGLWSNAVRGEAEQ